MDVDKWDCLVRANRCLLYRAPSFLFSGMDVDKWDYLVRASRCSHVHPDVQKCSGFLSLQIFSTNNEIDKLKRYKHAFMEPFHFAFST